MFYIPQVSKSSCGFACLKMLLANVQKDERYLYLPEDERHGCYSYKNLVNISQRYGVTLIGVKYDDKDDLRHLKTFPMILTVTKENEASHAVLIMKRRGNKFLVLDPSNGTYWQKADALISVWDGTCLAVNHIEKKKCNDNIIDINTSNSNILSFILQALAAVFIALATFFIKPEGPYLLPILFCVASALCEIFLRVHLLKSMQKCDKYIRKFIPYADKRDYFEFYKRSQEYKKSAMTLGLNLIFYVLVTFLVVTISLINSLTFAVPILVAIVAAFIDVCFFAPLKKNIEKDIAKQEESLKTVTEADEMEMQVKTMEVKAYRYAYLEFARKIVVGAFILLSGIVVALIDQSFAITNLVFIVCICGLLYQYSVPLISFDNSVSENRINKVRFNNIVHQIDEINSKKP